MGWFLGWSVALVGEALCIAREPVNASLRRGPAGRPRERRGVPEVPAARPVPRRSAWNLLGGELVSRGLQRCCWRGAFCWLSRESCPMNFQPSLGLFVLSLGGKTNFCHAGRGRFCFKAVSEQLQHLVQ